MSLLADLNRQIINCQDCGLYKGRTKVVPGEGSENAEVVFIGEAPGWHEDQQGRPFVGPAGKFLDELLDIIGLNRTDVYICNMIKCRPPGNRDPLPGEMKSCQKWLDSQLQLLKPRVIVTLGRYSMARYFPGQSISKIHGKWRREDNNVYFAMYHPAAALHQQSLKAQIIDDIKKLKQLLLSLKDYEPEKVSAGEEEPKQLTMF